MAMGRSDGGGVVVVEVVVVVVVGFLKFLGDEQFFRSHREGENL